MCVYCVTSEYNVFLQILTDGDITLALFSNFASVFFLIPVSGIQINSTLDILNTLAPTS